MPPTSDGRTRFRPIGMHFNIAKANSEKDNKTKTNNLDFAPANRQLYCTAFLCAQIMK